MISGYNDDTPGRPLHLEECAECKGTGFQYDTEDEEGEPAPSFASEGNLDDLFAALASRIKSLPGDNAGRPKALAMSALEQAMLWTAIAVHYQSGVL